MSTKHIYSPESRILKPRALLRAIAVDLLASRNLAWQLLLREINNRYRQSILGVLWAFFPPLVTTIIFVFLNGKNILNIGKTDIPYPVYVLLGTVLWQIFAESVTAPLKMFESCTPIMTKINIPREAPILAGMGQVLFYMGLQLLMALVALLFFDIRFSWSMLWALPAILVLISLGTGIGLFLVPFGALFKDVAEGTSLLLRFAFFLTPIVYPPPQTWPYSMLVHLNPVTPLLVGIRDLLTKGFVSELSIFLAVSFMSLFVFIIAAIFYRLSVPIALDRLGS